MTERLRGIQNIFLVGGPANGTIQHLVIGCSVCSDCDAWPVTTDSDGHEYLFSRELDEHRAMAEYTYEI